ncbi:MAG TPA: potassium-transporting ATPase subunit B, partial [Roseateles sp.]|nr:potassium-transporting ATPase subunit B [Roseateles sp.]
MTDTSIHAAVRGHRPALLDAAGFRSAVVASFAKLAPQHAFRNPVMAVVWLGTVLCAGLTVTGKAPPALGWTMTVLLFVT